MKNMIRKSLLLLVFLCLCLNTAFAAMSVEITKYDPYPAEAGKYVDVWIKVRNMGNNDLEGIELAFEPSYPFSLDPTAEAVKDVGKLEAGDFVIKKYKVRVDEDAVEGKNNIKLKVKDCKGCIWKEFYKPIEVEQKLVEFKVISISSEPSRIKAGDEDVKLVVTIENIGDENTQTVTTKLILPEGFDASESYSDTSNLGLVNAESSKDATFYIDVAEEVAQGSHETELVVKYRREGETDYKEEKIPVTLDIKPTPLFEIVSVETIPQKIGEEDEVELKIKIKNIGNDEGESTSVKVFKETGQPFDFEEKSDYVGNLKHGETGEAILKLSVDKGAAIKPYILDLEIRTVHEEDVLVFDKTIQLEVVKKTPRIYKKLGEGLAALALLVLALWFASRFKFARKFKLKFRRLIYPRLRKYVDEVEKDVGEAVHEVEEGFEHLIHHEEKEPTKGRVELKQEVLHFVRKKDAGHGVSLRRIQKNIIGPSSLIEELLEELLDEGKINEVKEGIFRARR
ncbi:MAG: COG1361 S-layer family protein [Nanoarchaeota archaeon]|nr:COG1361 S-layer family protein [Nanoarchaeota archaeon]